MLSQAKLTQSEGARRIGITPRTLRRWLATKKENDQSTIPFAHWVCLCGLAKQSDWFFK